MIFFDGIISSLQRSGGISVYFAEIVSRLHRDGVRYQVSNYGETSFLRSFVNNSGDFNVVDIKPRFLERYRRAFVPDRTSVFHSSYYRVPAAGRHKSVVTVHDFTYERTVGGARTVIHSMQKNRAIRSADAILCVSESTRQDLFHFLSDVDPNKVHVVHNGVSDTYKPLAVEETSCGLDFPFVLFVGARRGYKNFDLALKTVAFFADIHLVCVGGGPLTNSDRDLINMDLPDRFHFLDHVSDADLNSLYNSAVALLYPSSYEGFGIPVIEAMRAGCPVVAVANSSLPEVAGGAASLASAANVDALRSALSTVLDTDERSRLILLGIDNARRFSWERTYLETSKIYNEISSD